MGRYILALAIFLGGFLPVAMWHVHSPHGGEYIAASPSFHERVLLVPLDGRPPCKQFVIDLGFVGEVEVVAEPHEIQDYYSQKGDTAAARRWLHEKLPTAQAAIISVDQLLYGGLLAARENSVTSADIQDLTDFFRSLKQFSVPIYAFVVLPRLEPPDSIDGYHERRYIVEYSRLLGRQYAGQSIDEERLHELKGKISAASLEKYRERFTESLELIKSLCNLASEGALTRLIIGRDDGEPYGFPNIEQSMLEDYLKSKGIDDKQVFITSGADEIAFTLLGAWCCRRNPPRIFADYADKDAPRRVMPYMAINLKTCVEEKIAMLGGEKVSSPADADFTLLVSASDGNRPSMDNRRKTIEDLQKKLDAGLQVAVVDLSKHFSADETLFPLMVRCDFPVNQLIAYAGWNTASNSIGTAVAQGAVFSNQRRQKNGDELIALYGENVRLLNNRFLEDSLYLKNVIAVVNEAMKKVGQKNPADLDLEHNYRFVNHMMRQAMGSYIQTYRNSPAFRCPFVVNCGENARIFRLDGLNADMGYPWPRTFEIYLESRLSLYDVTTQAPSP